MRDAPPDDYRIAPEPPPAREHTSVWPGWIWSIPIAAIAIVAWLIVKQIAIIGPVVIVTFSNAAGISAGNTKVHYNGMQVGTVQSVHLTSDLQHVDVRIRMHSEMAGHLGSGTKFWISPGPNLSNLASLRSIIAGPTIEMLPHRGQIRHHFIGLQQPPTLAMQTPGRNFVLTAEQKGNLSPGATVSYKDKNVGTVAWIKLYPDNSFKLGVFIKAPYDALVHDSTRFWSASAVRFSMQSRGPSIELQSPVALLRGAIAFDTPSATTAEAPAPEDHEFTLYSNKDAAQYAPGPDAVTYSTTFIASGGGLAENAAVEMAGKRVGTVQSSRLVFNLQTGAVEEQATLDLEPSLMALAPGATWDRPRQQMNTLVNKLIARGLRAELGSTVPLVGGTNIRLAFTAAHSDAALLPGNPPGIPSESDGNNIQGIMTALNSISSKLNSLPLDRIGQNVEAVTARAADLATSTQLRQALNNLNGSVSNIQHLTAAADQQMPHLIAKLRVVAIQTNAAVRSARSLLDNQSGVTATGMETAGLSQTLYQLSEAARAIRQLANYLDRHPSALIRGRG